MAKELFKCTTCFKEKPISEFYAQKRSPLGHRTKCKSCEGQREALGASTSLDILLGLSSKNSPPLMPKEAKVIMNCFVESRMKRKPFEEILNSKGVERKLSYCIHFMVELRKAAREGMTLEQYLKDGRKYKVNFHNKVLVKAKRR